MRKLITLSLSLLLLFSPRAFSQPNQTVADMFEVGFAPGLSSFQKAQEIYQVARADHDGDGRLDYAMALVALHNHRYDGARDLFERAIATQKDNHQAWRGLVWLNVLTKNYELGLEQMKTFAEVLADPKLPQAQADQVAESARWIGKLVGFIEGPRQESFAPAVSTNYRNLISVLLPKDARKAFDKGRGEVLQQHRALTAKLTGTVKKELALDKIKKEEAIRSIAEDRDQNADKLTELDENGETAKADAEGAINRINGELEALTQRIRSLELEATYHYDRISDLQYRIALARLGGRRARDIGQPCYNLREIGRLSRLLLYEQAALRPIENELRQARFAGNNLLGQRAAHAANYQRTLKNLNRQRQKLDRIGKTLDRKERSAREPASGRTSRVKNLARSNTALKTYCPFSLTSARAKLLVTLQPK